MIKILKNFKFKKEKSLTDEIIKTQDAEGMYNLLCEMPNPDMVLRKTGKGIKALRELLANGHVGTCVESRKAGILSKKWKIEKGDCTEKEFEFWQTVLKNIDMHKFFEGILQAPLFGFVCFEVKLENNGKYLIPTKIEAKPQEWFYFKQNGELYFNSKTKSDGVLIDPDSPKIILARHRADISNPYGEALLSRCFWNVIFINGGMKFWMKFIEKYGMPFAIGKYDRSTADDEKESLFLTLKRMVQDAIAVIPNNSSVELMEAGGKTGSSEVYERIISKCEKNISKVILGQTLTTDIGSSGSYAAANTHQEVREDIINSDKLLCMNSAQEFINKIHYLNFGNINAPLLEIYDEEQIDQSLAERDNKIKNLGVKFTKKYIQKAYGLSEDDFELAEEQTGPIDMSDSEDINDFDKLDNLAEEIESDKLFNPILQPIIQHFKNTKNADECMEKLAELYPNMDTKELENTLTKVIFIAELLGRISKK